VAKRNKKKREISVTFFIFLPFNYRESEKSNVLDEDDYVTIGFTFNTLTG
jgi:hypothetical protein